MRLNKSRTNPSLQSVMRQLTAEYPEVPDDVTALIIQAALQDLPTGGDLSSLLPKARRVLGQSALMQAMQEAAPRQTLSGISC